MPVYENPEDAENGLHVLLLRAVPENKNGHKTLLELSRLLGISKWAIRKWINKSEIPPKRVKKIVGLSSGRVKIKDFHPYVYKD